MRTVLLILVVLAAAGAVFLIQANRSSEPVVIRITNEPEGQQVLDTGESTFRTGSIQWEITAYSQTDKTVTLKVRLGDGAPEGVRTRLAKVNPLRPSDSEIVQLVVAPPKVLGPFEAKLILYADELPDWSYELTVKGVMVDKPISGRYLSAQPAGIDLGSVRDGENKNFEFEVSTYGDKPVEVTEIRPRDPNVVQIFRTGSGFTVLPGERKKVEGVVRVAGDGKTFHTQVEVRSNAENAKVLIVTIGGKLRLDYDISPARLPMRSVYKSLARDFTIRINAAPDIDPFVVGSVSGLEPLFELAQPLGTEPSRTQTVSLRLKKDAPAGRELHRGDVRIGIEPAKSELKWPYALRVLPPVNANPPEVNFGTVTRAKLDRPMEKTVQILTLPGREFKVTGAQSQRGRFHVRVPEHRAAMAWEVIVSLPALSDKGIYRDQILVETTDPEVPRLLIPVRAVVR